MGLVGTPQIDPHHPTHRVAGLLAPGRHGGTCAVGAEGGGLGQGGGVGGDRHLPPHCGQLPQGEGVHVVQEGVVLVDPACHAQRRGYVSGCVRECLCACLHRACMHACVRAHA